MKRKYLVLNILILSLILCSLSLFACARKSENGDGTNDSSNSQHTTHSYVTTVIDPTCVEQGYTLHKCSCGEEYKDNYTNPSGHQWDIESTIEESSCTKDGVKEIECSVCHATKNENIPASHSWSEWTSLNDDYHIRSCSVCLDEETEEQRWVNNACTLCSNEVSGYTVGLKYSAVEEDDKIVAYCVEGIGSASDLDIVIPPAHNDLPVISIKGNAFKNCKFIKSIAIPNSVESIGAAALSGCSALQSLVTPFVGACLNIDGEAGLLGYMFGTIEYENSVKTKQISYSFLSTTETTDFYLPKGLTKVSITKGNVSSGAFSGCENISEVALNEGINRIGENAFNGCKNLERLALPNSITYVGKDAFNDCGKLNYTDYNNGRYFGNSDNPYIILFSLLNTTMTTFAVHNDTKCILPIFYVCSNLHSLTIPDGITSAVSAELTTNGAEAIDALVNNGAATMKNSYIYIGNSNNPYLVLYNNRYWSTSNNIIENTTKVIADYALVDSGYYNSNGLIIPDSVQYVGKATFTGHNKSIQTAPKITIGSGVVDMTEAFTTPPSHGSSNLEEIEVSKNNAYYTSIDGVLYNKDCTNLICYPASKADEEYSILPTCKIISPKAFSGCEALKKINFPNNLIGIGYYAFFHISIARLELPKKVITIGQGAIQGCRSLTNIVIPDSVTSIGSTAFYYCNSLTSIEIPNSVTSIGQQAFAFCSSLTSVTIGNSVTSIGSGAFDFCNSLTSVYYTGTIADWCKIQFNSSAGANPLRYAHNFYIDNQLVTEVEVPYGVTEIKARVFYGCSSLTSIVIPNSVTSIGRTAFYNCNSLTSVYYKGTLAEWGLIDINTGNDPLTTATLYCFSENQPTDSGNYWHYNDNGEIIIWE